MCYTVADHVSPPRRGTLHVLEWSHGDEDENHLYMICNNDRIATGKNDITKIDMNPKGGCHNSAELQAKSGYFHLPFHHFPMPSWREMSFVRLKCEVLCHGNCVRVTGSFLRRSCIRGQQCKLLLLSSKIESVCSLFYDLTNHYTKKTYAITLTNI